MPDADTLAEATKKLSKKLGSEIGGLGANFMEFERLPSGIAALDIALAGGIPLGSVSILYGHESSGKTSLCLRLAAQHQHRFPDDAVAWLDPENSWDPEWAVKHGVDPSRVYVYKPTSAEEACDVVDAIAFAKDAGLLVLDSIPALSSIKQLEKQGEQHVMAGATKEVSDVLRKIGGASLEHTKRNHRLTTIYINQLRTKIGVMFGNPETIPGPALQNYQAFLKLKLRQKPILKEKIAPVPIYAECFAKVEKKKFPICMSAAEWSVITYPHEGHKPLDVNNRRVIEKMLEAYGMLAGSGKEWLLWGEVFSTKTAALDAALDDYDGTITSIIQKMLEEAQ